jgi:hypothetical protein
MSRIGGLPCRKRIAGLQRKLYFPFEERAQIFYPDLHGGPGSPFEEAIVAYRDIHRESRLRICPNGTYEREDKKEDAEGFQLCRSWMDLLEII